MYSIRIRENDAGQRLDKYLKKLLPEAPDSFLYKMLRKKNITVNGKKAAGDQKLSVGEEVKLFFSEETLQKFSGGRIGGSGSGNEREKGADDRRVGEGRAAGKARGAAGPLKDWILYEDKDVLFINKPAGILSQPDASHLPSLGEYLTDYLLSTGALTREDLLTFRPGVCNRLDRNTSGLVCAGGSLMGLQALSALIRDRSVKKEYLLLVQGHFEGERTIEAYLHKDEKCNKVWVLDEPAQGAMKVVTRIRAAGWGRENSLLVAELITGKSHQIRACLAHIGLPLLGDGKYGGAEAKKMAPRQMLHAYQMSFPREESILKALQGRVVTAPPPEDFLRVFKRTIRESELILDKG